MANRSEITDLLVAGHPVTGAYSADDATAYNEMTDPNLPGPILAHDIERYLQLVDKWADISDAADNETNAPRRRACKKCKDALRVFVDFDMGDPQVSSVVESTLDGLITDGYIDANDKTTIMSMGYISHADQQNVVVNRVSDITHSRP